MPRRYKKYRKYNKLVKSVKYSNETFAFIAGIDNSTQGTYGFSVNEIVPAPSNVLGTRKVKNFTINILVEETLTKSSGEADAFDRARIAWALIFLPEGIQPSTLNFGNQGTPLSLYEPNQNVIASGVCDSNQTYRFKSRLARNLNAGDTIVFVMRDLQSPDANEEVITLAAVSINYAITF